MQRISVEGALFFGRKVGFLIKNEILMAETPVESIVHSLRHFREVPTDWKKRIMEMGAKEEDIERELAYSGSKWNQEIEELATPERMMAFCLNILLRAVGNGAQPLWINRWDNDICYSSHLIFSKEPIGTEGIISLGKLPKGIPVRKEMRQISPEGPLVEVNVVEIEPPTTNNIVVALARKRYGKTKVWTMYPGIIVPKLPRPGQLPEEYAYNQDFWGKHALIK